MHALSLKRALTAIVIIVGIFYANPTWTQKVRSEHSQESSTYDQTGYCQEISGVDFARGHTLDLSNYVKRNLGKSLDEISKSFDRFLILVGDPDSYLPELEREGITELKPLAKSYGTHTLSQAIDKNRKSALVISNLQVREQVLRSQLLLLSSGVAGNRVKTIGRLPDLRKKYLQTFCKMGRPPELAIYGFAGTILKKVLAANPWALSSKVKFKWSSFQKKKMAYLRPETQQPFFVVTLADGTRIWLLTNVYGESARYLFEASSDYGVKDFMVLGTGGSLNPNLKLNELISPREMVTAGSKPTSTFLAPLKSVPNRGTYSRVITPLIETKAWLEQSIESSIDVVDVELGHIIEAHQAHSEVRLRAALLISDVMVGEQKNDLSKWTPNILHESADKIFSLIKEETGRLSDEAWALKQVDIFYK